MFGCEKTPDHVYASAQHGLRQCGIGLRRLNRLDQPGKQPESDHEILFARENPRSIEKTLNVRRQLDEMPEPFGVGLSVHRRRGDASVDGRVEQVRPLRDDLRKTRRAAKNIGEKLAHRRV